jgi:hypothetical protein
MQVICFLLLGRMLDICDKYGYAEEFSISFNANKTNLEAN